MLALRLLAAKWKVQRGLQGLTKKNKHAGSLEETNLSWV